MGRKQKSATGQKQSVAVSTATP